MDSPMERESLLRDVKEDHHSLPRLEKGVYELSLLEGGCWEA